MSKLSKKTKVALLGAGLYVIIPLDLIPDFIVGFGQVDDLDVSNILAQMLIRRFEKIKKSENSINDVSETRLIISLDFFLCFYID